jgi:hypothetical protein
VTTPNVRMEWSIRGGNLNKTISSVFLLLVIASTPLAFSFVHSATKNVLVPIATHNVDLRVEPSIDSKIIMKLNPFEHRVSIIQSTNNRIYMDGIDGCWVLIDLEGTKGWIFDYYLAGEDKFRKVNLWSYQTFSECRVKYCPEYIFNTDGSFELYFISPDESNYPICSEWSGEYIKDSKHNRGKCKFKGHLYRYLDVIWAKLDEGYNLPFENYLYFDIDGSLCLWPKGKK